MHVRLNPERSGTTRLYLSQNMCRFYSWTTLPPSPSLLACPLAPGYLLLARRWCPMSPTPKHARSSEDDPFGPASHNGVFAGRVVGRISLPRRRSCLVGAWRDADFAIIAITTKRTTPECRTTYVTLLSSSGWRARVPRAAFPLPSLPPWRARARAYRVWRCSVDAQK